MHIDSRHFCRPDFRRGALLRKCARVTCMYMYKRSGVGIGFPYSSRYAIKMHTLVAIRGFLRAFRGIRRPGAECRQSFPFVCTAKVDYCTRISGLRRVYPRIRYTNAPPARQRRFANISLCYLVAVTSFPSARVYSRKPNDRDGYGQFLSAQKGAARKKRGCA